MELTKLGKPYMHKWSNGYLASLSSHRNSMFALRYVLVKSSCRDISISAHVFARLQTDEHIITSPVPLISFE